ncbi:hypothetical protein MKC54_09780 [[Clostridium] innocuum]|nr:hypothetical protein [[Clostridium] innocuum]MCR0577176.1 hypothetical protein [[Clostridium] innocuum]
MEYILYGEFITDKSITKSVKKLHSAALSDLFATNDSLLYFRRYRGMEFLRLDMKVRLYNGSIGYVIGSEGNQKAYIPLTDKIEHFHPIWQTTYFDSEEHVIADYKKATKNEKEVSK